MRISEVLKSLLLTLAVLVVAALGLETWERRWAWPVDDSWYALKEDGDQVEFRCQRYAPVRFSRQPAPGVVRVLALGGSTTFGYPEHPQSDRAQDGNRFGFVGVMQASLDAAFPGRFELVDLGVNGGGSEDSLRLARRALEFGAAAVVIYDGHNEFMNVPADFHPLLWHSVLYQHLMLLAPRRTEAPGWVGPAVYGGEAQYQAIVGQFSKNLDAMVGLFRDRGVPVVLATQASNHVGFDPAWSTSGDPLLLSTLSRLGDVPVLQHWRAAPMVAELDWAAGLRLQGALRAGALQAALDHDGMPIRAPSAINQVIRDVAQAQQAVLVDAEAAVGDADFYDNVHPLPEAALRLGAAMLAGLQQAGVVPVEVPVLAPVLSVEEQAAAERRNAGYWLRQACVRAQDPGLRLSQAALHAQRALVLAPGDGETAAILQLSQSLVSGQPVRISDPTLRARLASIHPRVAALLP